MSLENSTFALKAAVQNQNAISESSLWHPGDQSIRGLTLTNAELSASQLQGVPGYKLIADGSPESQKSIAELAKLGFPSIDVSGFQQEAPNHDHSFWHGFKHLFVKDPTNEDKVRSTLEKEFAKNPEFQKEEKELKEYRRQVQAWETQMSMNPGPMPTPPDCPMHKELEKQVKSAETEISNQVRHNMSPADQARLQKQMDDYKKAVDDATKIHDPFGTGEGFRPLPKPGHAILDYYDRIGEQTERWVQEQGG